MNKDSLASMVSDKSVNVNQSALTLILTVLLKYGIAPIAAIYLGYILMLKDAVILKKDEVNQKNTDTIVGLVREQTVAIVKQTAVMEGVSKNIEANTKKMEDSDRRSTR